MKKIIKSIVSAVVVMFAITSSVFAGAGHSHNASEAKIERNAKMGVKRYIKANKIPKSWANAKMVKMEKEEREGGDWIVTFKNNQIKDKSKNTLNIYLTTYGKVQGGNYKK